MSPLRRLIAGIRSLFRKDQDERELDDELRAYLEAAAADKMAKGLSREEALRSARIELGSLDAVKEEVRDVGWESLVEGFLQDSWFAIRTLCLAPGFTGFIVLTLALGIGANTAIFSVINGVLLKPLDYDRSDRLVVLHEYAANFGQMSISYPNFSDWRLQNHVFEKIESITEAVTT